MLLVALILAASGVSVALRYRRSGPWEVPDSAKAMRNPVPPTPEGIAAAAAIYSDRCTRCHGDHGDGDGPDAKMYKPQPASLAVAMHSGEHPMTDGEIFWKITEGRQPMPSFKKQLTDEQRWELVNFLRTLDQPR